VDPAPVGAIHRTAWGGLLFLLATAADADVPYALLADPALERRTLRWILAALGPRLVDPPRGLAGPGPADPAVLALAGLTPVDEPPARFGPPRTADEDAALDAHARRWGARTAERLRAEGSGGDPTADQALVTAAVQRAATVVADPGWIEIHLALDDVDVAVRRAGLDLDPGWVPWLGAAVRFCYA
jgi:hypothetical protein